MIDGYQYLIILFCVNTVFIFNTLSPKFSFVLFSGKVLLVVTIADVFNMSNHRAARETYVTCQIKNSERFLNFSR